MMGRSSNLPSIDPRFRLGITTGRRFCSQFTGAVYELTETIGIGATAVVFRCVQVNTEIACSEAPQIGNNIPKKVFAAKVIDLKTLRLRTNIAHERKKFLREVAILQNLRHTHIVNLVDFAQTTNEFFFVMEYVEGGDLFVRIASSNSLTEPQACYIMHQLVSGVKYIHEENVIHRDLKPENILICSENNKGYFQVKIADFGLAKLVRRGFSAASTFVGTPQYWAPEVINASCTNAAYNESVDVWSLGVILYVMLGGTYPFDDKLGNINTLICNGQYHFHYPRFRYVSMEAKALIRKLLTIDVSDRYTISQLQVDPWMLSFLSSDDREHFLKDKIVSPEQIRDLVPRNAMPSLPPMDSFLDSYDIINIDNEYDMDDNENYDKTFSRSSSWYIPNRYERVNADRPMRKLSSEEISHVRDPNSFFVRDNVESARRNPPISGTAKVHDSSFQRNVNEKTKSKAANERVVYSKFPKHFNPVSRLFSSGEHYNQPSQVKNYLTPEISTRNEVALVHPSDSNAQKGNEQVRTAFPTVHSFQFGNLLSFQLNVAMRMHLAAFAFRNDPRLRNIVGERLAECFEAQKLTLCVISRFEQTCISILSIIPDLTIAITENLSDFALGSLNDIQVWISSMMADVKKMRQQYHTLLNGLNKLIAIIEGVKQRVESNVSSFISSTSEDRLSHCGSSHQKMLKLTDAMYHSDESIISDDVKKLEYAGRSPFNSKAREAEKDSFTSVNDKSCQNARSPAFIEVTHLRNHLLKQLELIGNPNLPYGFNYSDDSESVAESHTRLTEELLDFLFLNSGMNVDMLTANKMSCPSSLADVMRISEVAEIVSKEVSNQTQSTSSRETHSTDSKTDTVESSGCELQGAVDAASSSLSTNYPAGDPTYAERLLGEPSNDSAQVKEDTKQMSIQLHNKPTKNEDFCVFIENAFATSKVLFKALDELRHVDAIMDSCTLFWDNIEATLNRMFQMRSHAERMICFSSNPQLQAHLLQRIAHYESFWENLEIQCQEYRSNAELHFGRLRNFARELQKAADKISTFQAFHTVLQDTLMQ